METLLLSNAAAFFAALRVDLFGGAIEQAPPRRSKCTP